MTPVPPPARPLGQKGLRAYWQRQRPTVCQADRCLYPGQPIRYGGERTPLHLDVGHKEFRALDPTRTAWWPHETRPEHQGCNRRQGASLGGRIIAQRRGHPRRPARRAPRLDTSRAW